MKTKKTNQNLGLAKQIANLSPEQANSISPEVIEKIKTAIGIADKLERKFIPALFTTVLEEAKVKVNIPGKNAKDLSLVKGHKILVFQDENLLLEGLTMIDIKDHFIHRDTTTRLADNQVKPSVVRHLCVTEENLGKTIVAKVIIKEKTNLLNGEKMILIDIAALVPGNYSVEHTLRLGVRPTGNQGEVIIPGTDRCIRFDKIKKERIINPIPAASEKKPEEKIKKTSTDNNFIIEEARSEKKHRLVFKAPIKEKVKINKPLSLKKKNSLTLDKNKPSEKSVFQIFKEGLTGTKRIIHLMHN
jgi:hypothetical protein